VKFVRPLAIIWIWLIVLSSVGVAESSAAPLQIWFNPMTWDLDDPGHKIEYTEHDFPAMLQPNAPWQTALSRIAVLKLPGNIAWSYPDLSALVSFINTHHLKVAFEDGMLFTGGTCGKGIEGMSQDPSDNHESVGIAQKWKAAGGSLDYVVMDAPFFYGHYYAQDCRYPIPEVARRVGATLAGMRASFPNIHVIDAEGPGKVPNDQWLPDMATWFNVFRQTTDQPIEGVSLDLHWSDLRPGQTLPDTARRATAYFHQLGVRSGLIINADSTPDMSDAQWMEENRRHIRDAAAAKLGLDFVVINSWQGHPQRNLPETDPTAYTSLINYAAQVWK